MLYFPFFVGAIYFISLDRATLFGFNTYDVCTVYIQLLVHPSAIKLKGYCQGSTKLVAYGGGAI